MKQEKGKNWDTLFRRTGVVVAAALVCTLLWGSAFPGVKVGYTLFAISEGDIPSKLVFAGVRFFAAGLLVLAFGWICQKRFPRPKGKTAWGWTALLGLVQTALQYLFFYIGLANTTGVKSSILNATGSFFGVLLAHFFCKGDRMTKQKALGCLLGFSGCVLVSLSSGEGLAGFSFLGEGFVIFAALSFGVGFVISKRATALSDAATVTGWQLSIGGAVLLLAGLLFGGNLTVTGWQAVLLLAYLAALSAVAFALWSQLLKCNPVSRISVYNFFVPVFGTALSVLCLGEGIPDWRTPAALALVCLGIWVVNRKLAEQGKA